MASDVFAVLADPTRRRLVEILHDGERSVNELVDDVAIHQPGVSRHLRILQEAGFVTVRVQGQRRLYAMRPRPEPLMRLQAWMRKYVHDEKARLQRLSDFIDESNERKK